MIIFSSNSSTPSPVFPEVKTTSLESKPKVSTNSWRLSSGSALGRSILFTTGIISNHYLGLNKR